ncbi:tripartite motif-containing protein 16-like [Oryzias latipes]|uniref:FinTRIM family, member 87 n=1 Tax=Oryzias latipes TaxID=8090 RepID=H2MTV3_ORYLA|nr:tripartite motif-containing protein 16-like [Oryzias latipes]
MATTTISIEQDQFCCPVCLEVLRDPATIPCGHSYCLDCIEDYWSKTKHRDHYSCPQCRQEFSPKPLLRRNTVLAEVVDKFLRSEVQAAAQHLSRSEEVKCGVCTGRKARAVKSCLTCLESYCEAHLRAHDERFHRKAHQLIAASDHLREKLCQQHDKLLRLYCLSDQQCVCSQCVKEKHKGHDTVSVGDERATQQKKLRDTSLKSMQTLKDTEKDLKYVIRYIKHSTDAVEDESERIFSKLVQSIEKHRADVKELLRFQEKAVIGHAEEMLENIQREMSELRRTNGELERLCHTEDHLLFLQNCRTLHFPTNTVEMPNTDALTYVMYKSMRGTLVDVQTSLEGTLHKEVTRISDKVSSLKDGSSQNIPDKSKAKEPEIQFTSEPKTRADFLQYYHDLTLDMNTANSYLSLSDGRRSVTTRAEPQPYPDHPDRFTRWAQVLCRAGMAGRCYWEVEWAGKGGVSIGVCYKNMSRSGDGSECKLGHNSRSWTLDCSGTACSFTHNKESVAVSAPCGRRIGVFLDFRGGALSFYNVSESMVLLHKEKVTLTQPVYPGFWVGLGSTLKLCAH